MATLSRATNVTRGTVLATRVATADTFYSRFKGLMGVTDFPLGEGLLIRPCTSIHTFFMRVPIDAVFLGAGDEVVDVCHVLVPWRMSRVYFNSRGVLELPAGTAEASGTQRGDRLQFAPEP